MPLKNIFKEKTLFFNIVLILFLIVLSFSFHQLFAYLILQLSGFDISLNRDFDLSDTNTVFSLKLIQLFSSFGIFITPFILFSYLTDFDFKLTEPVKRNLVLLTLVIMLLITPFISFIYAWNQTLDLPNWMLDLESNSTEITNAFLLMHDAGDLMFNLLLLAIVPAIGEELCFRGYLQQKLTNYLNKPYMAIFVSAFVFSAIHLQFQGFIPRFILGMLLGYFFYWSKSLWLAIIAHFTNNAQAVIFSYPFFKENIYVKNSGYSIFSESQSIDLNLVLFSIFSVTLLLFMFYKISNISEEGASSSKDHPKELMKEE